MNGEMELNSLFCFCFIFLDSNRNTKSSNGCVLIFVYMTYTMLPVRLREALFGGLLLSIVHVYLSATCCLHVNWPEVILLNFIMNENRFLTFVCVDHA